MAHSNPEFRRRAQALAESEWGEPVTVVHLGDVKPVFDVPGRRRDGTIKGKRLIRRFFWNLLRGTVGGIASAALTLMSGQPVHVFFREGRVTGPADAAALALVDAARPARSPWLAYSESHVGVIETGFSFYDPKDSPPAVFLWQAAKPTAPTLRPSSRTLAWPDGSTYQYHVDESELKFQRESRST
ncbi:hypothetical protein [Flindersiella endophytica]